MKFLDDGTNAKNQLDVDGRIQAIHLSFQQIFNKPLRQSELAQGRHFLSAVLISCLSSGKEVFRKYCTAEMSTMLGLTFRLSLKPNG